MQKRLGLRSSPRPKQTPSARARAIGRSSDPIFRAKVGAIGGRHHDHAAVALEAVHLREDLVPQAMGFSSRPVQ